MCGFGRGGGSARLFVGTHLNVAAIGEQNFDALFVLGLHDFEQSLTRDRLGQKLVEFIHAFICDGSLITRCLVATVAALAGSHMLANKLRVEESVRIQESEVEARLVCERSAHVVYGLEFVDSVNDGHVVLEERSHLSRRYALRR